MQKLDVRSQPIRYGDKAANWRGGWKEKLPTCKVCDKKLSRKDATHCQKHAVRVINKYGEHNPSWKGDKVGYTALHKWVYGQLGKPKKCENCGTETANRYEWANLTREYIRDISKWTRLCVSCHVKHDRYNHVLEIQKKI